MKNKLNVLPPNPEASDPSKAVGLGRFPSWLHRPLPQGGNIFATNHSVQSKRLHTVCEEARCPNLLECYSKKTATFLILGKECTRACGFCSIDFSKTPKPPEPDEPQRVAESVKELGLKHVVLTMVARDDLPDGGAAQIAAVVRQIRHDIPGTTIEVLTSDFSGNEAAWDTVLAAQPEIFNYNIETVSRLTPQVRHKATYERTLTLLSYVRAHGKELMVKSGIMLGLGETEDEVRQTIKDLKDAGCDIITIGQYLQASRQKLRVKAFIHPDQFKLYENYGYSLGVKYMYCGPFVRSSYNADLIINRAGKQQLTINSV